MITWPDSIEIGSVVSEIEPSNYTQNLSFVHIHNSHPNHVLFVHTHFLKFIFFRGVIF